MSKAWLKLSIAVALAGLGCAQGGSADAPTDGGSASGSGGSGGDSGQGGSATSSGGSGGAVGDALCPTELTFAGDTSLDSVRVAGEWHGFDLSSAALMTPDAGGVYRATIELPVGLHAYKLVTQTSGDVSWRLDPEQTRRKYVDGVENSAVLVPDCNLPSLEVEQSAAHPSGYDASLRYRDAIDGSGPDTMGFQAVLIHDGQSSPLTSTELAVDSAGDVVISLSGLEPGKYRVELTAASRSGRISEPQPLIFWVEDEAFSWRDALIYMLVTDRFRDGDGNNNPTPINGVDSRGAWQGGDLEGVRTAIADGTFDKLGVRALWLTPWQTNFNGSVDWVTGYHGYWPNRAREVDPALGGAQALHALVREAHAHGIRVLMDYVINHVHASHEYTTSHPDWFRSGCTCGDDGCDWTERALDCLFADYMPDIDHTVPAATQAIVDDAIWWLDTFDLDGLRVDAVKHVEEVATRNLAAAVRDTFEAAGTQYYLMGETAMGWNDCPDPCNDGNYGTIARYIGPHGLDGQLDFVLYHGVAYRTFAYGDRGMLHADYWLQHGLSKWPADAVMPLYIGSHDTARFTTLADYRGQDYSHPRWMAGNQLQDVAQQPLDAEPYRRMRIALSWLLTIPGAPVLYYGDEYAQWGGADPNNRQMWRDEQLLGGEELATLALTRKLGAARRDLLALRRGDYRSLGASEDTLVFARTVSSGPLAVVGLTRSYGAVTTNVDVSSLGLVDGTLLYDQLGGPPATVSSSQLTLNIPASGVVILAP